MKTRTMKSMPITLVAGLLLAVTSPAFAAVADTGAISASTGASSQHVMMPGITAQPLLDGQLAKVEAKGNFPWGYCTWFVDQQVRKNWGKDFKNGTTWQGNAINWWKNATGKIKKGDSPKVNSIVVFNVGPVGHVGWVISKDGRNFTYIEMNGRAGFGKVSTVSTSTKTNKNIVGFIYKK